MMDLERELRDALPMSDRKWTTKEYTSDEWKLIYRWRKRYQRGTCTRSQRDNAIAEIKKLSQTSFLAAHPPFPKGWEWRRAVKYYERIRRDVLDGGGLTGEIALKIVGFARGSNKIAQSDVRKRMRRKKAQEKYATFVRATSDEREQGGPDRLDYDDVKGRFGKIKRWDQDNRVLVRDGLKGQGRKTIQAYKDWHAEQRIKREKMSSGNE